MKDLPNFDDFIKTFDRDTLEEIGNSGNLTAAEQENIQLLARPTDTLGIQTGTISLRICLALLKKYHEWLIPQISSD